MPVIQTSLAPADLGSDSAQSCVIACSGKPILLAIASMCTRKVGIGEGDMAEGQVSAALQLLADAYFGRRDGKTGAFVLDLRVDRQQFDRD